MSTPANIEHGALSDARTSEDAAKMSCPFIARKCQTYDCMAWRWIGFAYEHTKTPGGFKPEGDDWVHLGQIDGMSNWRRPRSNATRKGYCGAVAGTANVTTRDI